MVSRRYAIRSSYFWYVGVITEVELLYPGDLSSDSGSDEPEPRHVACCLMEDGVKEEVTLDILATQGDSPSNMSLCPVGPNGRPLRAARRGASASTVTSGLLLGSTETKVHILSAVHCDEGGACGSLPYGTCTLRASSSSQQHKW